MAVLGAVRSGKTRKWSGEFWGPVIFHGITAILALWLLTRALPQPHTEEAPNLPPPFDRIEDEAARGWRDGSDQRTATAARLDR